MNSHSLKLKDLLYSDNYLAPGFTLTGDPNCPSAMCIVCGKNLANTAISFMKLKRHLKTRYFEVSDRNRRRLLVFKKFKISGKLKNLVILWQRLVQRYQITYQN
ncbi:Zinc finger BED domain-containing protein 5 [Thelohanellus kitauei]|uniref:Zinc finger BED domain-containing protein 5 n=1 Tax=Thelohanellus kitauei TaxID=669202 RepID=A0A0C2MTK3_THEKT|nr:Zinc finger BED domain-containing protein 5 [Thelohanellus kitauei]